MKKTQVKICCISSIEETNLCFFSWRNKPIQRNKKIQKVQSYGLDLCSGVRTNGKLDEIKLTAFFNAIKQ
ncbi:hypothetical protein [uncultured Lutibacter sp.]|uniref:hypothetical protein n=1 Tax=uncultured Lutibacter sp. TaxID=437739 RepID=UPI002618B099|nr:hypothetical protein [uncultured Lutibacter sp.]